MLDEIREFHFHVYFFQSNAEHRARAMALRERILQLNTSGYFTAVPLARINDEPRGPHPTGSYEVWVPCESFWRVYQFFLKERNGLSVLVHPLTRQEIADHTERAVWMGAPLPLDMAALQPLLPSIPKQHEELKLGYSAEEDNKQAALHV